MADVKATAVSNGEGFDAHDGVLLCGHGSRSEAAVSEFAALARRVAGTLAPRRVAWGYLEFARPVIEEGLERLRLSGCRRILALPVMLFAAGHVKNDIPSVLNAWAVRHRTPVRMGRAFGLEARLLRLATERIQQALRKEEGAAIPLHETLLVTVGRGASDPDANANVAKITRMLWEGMGFGWGETAYSGVTFPLVRPALEHAARLGYRRIVVFPYFLFTGLLVERIHRQVDEVAARHPEVAFIKAGYLGNHPLLSEVLLTRLSELSGGGDVSMNCQLCKYRTRIPGFEEQKGEAQRGHHHHVEGAGAGGVQGASADGNTARDSHGHHPPYPHANHPLGPRSLEPS